MEKKGSYHYQRIRQTLKQTVTTKGFSTGPHGNDKKSNQEIVVVLPTGPRDVGTPHPRLSLDRYCVLTGGLQSYHHRRVYMRLLRLRGDCQLI